MKTGDILIARRFTGHTTEVMLLSGSFANHAAMIIKDAETGLLFVIDCFHDNWGEHGPPGVKKMLLEKWLDTA